MTEQLPTELQLEAARTTMAVVEQPRRETLQIVGPDRVSWLNGLVTCDVAAVRAGRGTWGFLLSRAAKIESVLWIVEHGDSLLLSVAPETAALVLAELDRRLIMEDAELRDVSDAWRWSLCVGPQAATRVGAQAVAEPELAHGSVELLGLGELAVARPVGRGELGGPVLDEAAWTLLRLQRHWGEFGVDFGSTQRPHEAALERRGVAWDKGCYLGQEVVCMQEMRGKVRQALRVFTAALPPTANLAAGMPLKAQEASAGEVTSAAFDPTQQRWWLMARVTLAALPGPLELELGSERHAVELSTQPL